MKKIMAVFAWLGICLALLGGCANEPGETTGPTETIRPTAIPTETIGTGSLEVPQVPEDYFALLCENTDVEISNQSHCRTIRYKVVSGSPLDQEMVRLSFDQDVPFRLSLTMEEETPEKTLTWVKDVLNMYYQQHQGQLVQQPELYTGVLTVQFPDSALERDVTLHRLTVSLQGKNYSYDIGSIHLLPELFSEEIDGRLQVDTVSQNAPNAPNAEGSFYADMLQVTAKEDVTIQSVSFLQEDRFHLEEFGYTKTLPDGTQVDSLWDGTTPISLSKGETMEFSVKGQGEALKNTPVGTVQTYLVLHYTSGEAHSLAFCELIYQVQSEAL